VALGQRRDGVRPARPAARHLGTGAGEGLIAISN